MLELREALRYSHGNSDYSYISVGDIVVVRTEGQPRGFWKIAKVERTITGQDGVARGAVVRVAGKGGRTKTLSRPIQHLFPLEINCHIEDPEQQTLSEPLQDGFSNEVSSDGQANVEPDDPRDDDEETADLPQPQPRLNSPPCRSTRRAARIARDAIMAQALEETD